MTNGHAHLVRFDEHGCFDIADEALMGLVALNDQDVTLVGGGFNVLCDDTNGYCGNDTMCGNHYCGNSVCVQDGVNLDCNFHLNPVC